MPRTKLEAPVPDGIARGRLVIDGRVLEVVGWRATVGHNWGAEHAERWVWLHAAGFEDEPEAWLELTLARIRVGGATLPWVANGAVYVGGERLRLGGLGHVPGVRVVGAAGAPGGDRPRRARRDPRGRPRRPRPGRRLPLRRRAARTRVAGEREVLHAGLAEVRLGVRRPAAPRPSSTRPPAARTSSAAASSPTACALQPYPDP